MEAHFSFNKAGRNIENSKAVRSSRRRVLLITSNVVASLVVLIAGCSSWDIGSDWTNQSSRSDSGLEFGQEGQRLDQTRSLIKSTAQATNLPEQFVSEARIGMSEVERNLADARAIEMDSEAKTREAQARITARRKTAESTEQMAIANADNLRQQATAKQSKNEQQSCSFQSSSRIANNV